jgi:hypothetical protein
MKPSISILSAFSFLVLGQAMLERVSAQDGVLTVPEPAKAPSERGVSTPAPAPAVASATSSAPLSSGSSNSVPSAFPAQRYNALMEKSPFALATAAPEPTAPAENFATNWVLTGISKTKGKGGAEDYTVFVRSRDLSIRHVITKDKPTDDGVALVSVEEAPVPTKASVTLRKGAETGRVEFDQAAVAASASVPVPPPAGQPQPGAPIPRPGMQGSVPRPGASQAGQVPQNVPVVEPRRRVQPIQEPP